MIKYSLSVNHPHRQYIQFSAEFSHDGSETFHIQLPSWRPGRYELANFAKNIRGLHAVSENGSQLKFKKKSKDLWEIKAKGESVITINYEYYSAELNAGSTFLDENLLYVNPVNCFLFRPGFEEVDGYDVSLKIPDNFLLASPLAASDKKTFISKNVHELMDSPFMASANLDHHSFAVGKCNFHFWVNGTHELSLQKMESDFIPFCEAQIRDFNGIPVDDYLFLFHFLDHKAYHGVEHEKCTVITLGPSSDLLKPNFYEELIGVSSHELYHTWNVKALRPKDILPYNYSKENYSELGYVYEGVTTYLGDWYLLNSKVFDFDTYSRHLGQYLKRHFHNYGRHNYSVAESSYDTWLDGYTSGAPGRKVSIYTEGCLISFLFDLIIIKETKGEKSLRDVMTSLWEDFGQKGIGYTEESYMQRLEKVSGLSFSELFKQLVHGTADLRTYLEEILPDFGLKITFSESENYLLRETGIKTGKLNSGELKILDICPNSPGDSSGIHIGDIISSTHGEKDDSKELELNIQHMGRNSKVTVTKAKNLFFPNTALTRENEMSDNQLFFFHKWCGEN